jgi:hypothetical protein
MAGSKGMDGTHQSPPSSTSGTGDPKERVTLFEAQIEESNKSVIQYTSAE